MNASDHIMNILKNYHGDTDFHINDDKVHYRIDFSCEHNEEPWDIAWELHSEFVREIEELGLTDDNWQSDNDTIWGEIIYK